MKKLTNTYFKRSKKSEKAWILHKQLTSGRLVYAYHKKSSKSLSEKVQHRLSKPFSEDDVPVTADRQGGALGRQMDIDGVGADGEKHDQTDELPERLKEFEGRVSSSDMKRMVAIERDIAEVMTLTDNEQSPDKRSRNNQHLLITHESSAPKAPRSHKRCRSYMKLPVYADPDAHQPSKKIAAKKHLDDTGGGAAPGGGPSQCCICFENIANAVNMQCGHGGICYECGKSILMSNTRLCHLCREPLLFVLQMDLDETYQDFIKVVAASYLSDGESDEEEAEVVSGDNGSESSNDSGRAVEEGEDGEGASGEAAPALPVEELYDIMYDRYEKDLDPPDAEEVNTFARKQLEDLAVYENYVNIDMDLVSYRGSARESVADQSQEESKSAREE